MSGGQAAGETAVVIGRRDQPRNAVIQINFNEAINPVTVSGAAGDVKGKILIECMSGSDCVVDGTNFIACDADKDGAEDEVCLNGKFVLTNQYQTVEFISSNLCGVNGCGEKIYCLPAESNLRAIVFAASLANCGSGEINCTTRPPYTNCVSGICKDTSNNNYPMASMAFNGATDMALNSLDGDRGAFAEGPQSQSGTPPYYENDLLGLCFGGANSGKVCTDANKLTLCGTGIACKKGAVDAASVASLQMAQGDDYDWSFFINSTIRSGAPLILTINPTHSKKDVSLTDPEKIKFNSLMMNSTLRTGQTAVFDGIKTLVHKRLNLRSLSNRATGYWTACENIDDPAAPDGEPDWTETEIRHSVFPEFVSYRVQTGSGVKDIYQNCFKPSEGPLCTDETTDASPSCCPVGADINAVGGAGLDKNGTCK